jgi:phosphoglycerate-specific signal transduction histidine kinase
MLKTLSIRTGLLSLLAVMTLLLLIVSGIGIYALTQVLLHCSALITFRVSRWCSLMRAIR